MKGQFFIIAAVMITVSLIMIKGLLGIYSSEETHANMNMNIDDRQLTNILREYEYATGISSVKTDPNQTIYQYFSNFSEYMRGEKDARLLWITVFVNGTDQKYYINAGNYLKDSISLNISASNSTPSSTLLEIPDMSAKSYTFSSDINGTINITLRYSTGDSYIEDIFQVDISNMTSISSFTDITLISEESKIGTKNLYTANILV